MKIWSAKATSRSRFIATRTSIRSCRTPRARYPRRPAKSSFTRRRWPPPGSMPFPAFNLRSSRVGEKERKKYPLELLPRKTDNYMNSTFANLPGHRKMEARTSQRLEMHPDDAQPRGLADGDPVRVFNDRGSLQLTAMLNARLPAGVVAARLDWAKLHADRRQRERAHQRAAHRHRRRRNVLFNAGRSGESVAALLHQFRNHFHFPVSRGSGSVDRSKDEWLARHQHRSPIQHCLLNVRIPRARS